MLITWELLLFLFRSRVWLMSSCLPCTVPYTRPVDLEASLRSIVVAAVFQSLLCLTLCDPIDCSPLGSSVLEISQARRLEWVAISFSKGSSWPRDQIHVSCFGRWVFYLWATREAPSFYYFASFGLRLKPVVQVTSLGNQPRVLRGWGCTSLRGFERNVWFSLCPHGIY